MTKYFSRTFRVDWSDANADGEVHAAQYFRYVMETAWEWGGTVGLGIAESEALGLGWIVHETQITFHRPLRPDDVFDLTIWLAEWRRVRGTRFFELKRRDDGTLIAQGAQEVVSIDLKTLRPAAIPDTAVAKMQMETFRTVSHQKFPAFAPSEMPLFTMQRRVGWQDLDAQEHVNNANYVAFAEDAVIAALADAGWPPARFKAEGTAIENSLAHIRHLSPASWGETLQVSVRPAAVTATGGVWHVGIGRDTAPAVIAQCVIAWDLTDRKNARQCALPENLSKRLQEKADTGL